MYAHNNHVGKRLLGRALRHDIYMAAANRRPLLIDVVHVARVLMQAQRNGAARWDGLGMTSGGARGNTLTASTRAAGVRPRRQWPSQPSD